MAIISWPDLELRQQNVSCAICQQITPLQSATAGPYDANGEQAFACNQHFWSSTRLILGWTDFTILQQERRAPRPSPIAAQVGGDGRAATHG